MIDGILRVFNRYVSDLRMVIPIGIAASILGKLKRKGWGNIAWGTDEWGS